MRKKKEKKVKAPHRNVCIWHKYRAGHCCCAVRVHGVVGGVAATCKTSCNLFRFFSFRFQKGSRPS